MEYGKSKYYLTNSLKEIDVVGVNTAVNRIGKFLKEFDTVDSYYYLYPEGRDYSYFFNNNPECRLANQCFRIDYFLVSESRLPYVKKSEILTDVFETTNNPILLEIDLLKYQ